MIFSFFYHRRLNVWGTFELCNSVEYDDTKLEKLMWQEEEDVIETHHESGRFLLSETVVSTNVSKNSENQVDVIRYLFESKNKNKEPEINHPT